MLGLLHAYTHRVAIGTSCRLRFSDEPTTRGPLPIRKTRAHGNDVGASCVYRSRPPRVCTSATAGCEQRAEGECARLHRLGGRARRGAHLEHSSRVS